MIVIASEPTKQQRCDDLFFAIVGNVGSGATTTAKIIRDLLQRIYGYSAERVGVSEFIKESSVGIRENLSSLKIPATVNAYQDAGNTLRRKFGNDYLARRCVQHVRDSQVVGSRRSFIFDSLKHPDELVTLKKCYGERLITITVYAPERVRRARLSPMGYDEMTLSKIFERDELEADPSGQKTRDVAYLSDFFIKNSDDTDVELKKAAERYLEIIFGTRIHSPTLDETGMARAFGAAASSTCFSRQVGASVYSSSDKLLATGCNDVPKFGGGLYSEEDADADDKRCFKWGGKICHNDAEKERLYQEISDKIIPDTSVVKNGERLMKILTGRIAQSRVKDLIEFSRSVHAEMDAIVSVARSGFGSTVGGTLYSTTFPCHNCARHIVAAGIQRVVYIEPYPKSLALRLHSDSITVREGEKSSRVLFVQYGGVSPKVQSKYFISTSKRKSEGHSTRIEPNVVPPIGVSETADYRNAEALFALTSR